MTEHDGFQKLEEKIAKAVEVFKRTQAEKRALEQEVEKLRAGTKDRSKQSEAQERELIGLRREREEVRGRIEKLIEQIDALTKPDDAG
jgi:FtsZ-binding cell division protein ZapB